MILLTVSILETIECKLFSYRLVEEIFLNILRIIALSKTSFKRVFESHLSEINTLIKSAYDYT